jgi:hypothetical protein
MVYHDIFEARFAELQHDYQAANEGRGYPGAIRRALRRIAR